ncbi:hypothetical protein [Bartonella quintana]|uniref:PepSY domain-containing protein n=1 Tax=Bartonella quintana JK 68 TaxID=1134503 RepID=A0ABR4SR74_BARQI|nr:hypothetical protein [Bartonella quintana]KEC61646.1 hypothetical protein O7Y_00949 [Bartonella quintana JK 63]KEC67039.1 hypothetical protein O7U_00313 [Bartonella quintana JK 68]QUG71861.1 hypothetical protein FOL54_01705 [Bartonella quintana]
MRLNKNLKLIIFFMMIVCISSIVTISINEVFHTSHCQTFAYASSKNIMKPGKNSFTASQIKNCLMQNGFRNIKRLRLDDKGIWRTLVEFKKCHFLISVDYSGTVSIQNERKKHD